jgi:hypothetical protein
MSITGAVGFSLGMIGPAANSEFIPSAGWGFSFRVSLATELLELSNLSNHFT